MIEESTQTTNDDLQEENPLADLAPLPQNPKRNPVAPRIKSEEELDAEFDLKYNLLCEEYKRRHVGVFPRFEAHQIVKSAIDSLPSVKELHFTELKVKRLK